MPDMDRFSQVVIHKKQDLIKLAAQEREESDLVKKYSVSFPSYVDKVVRYTIIGEDKDGAFEISRRFNHFFALQKVLKDNWPGFYVPAIPDKKTTGNMDPVFLEERRALLERFLHEIVKYDFLRNSEVFYQFVHNEDVDKALV